jgi:menaquinone-9 beta-reductase
MNTTTDTRYPIVIAGASYAGLAAARESGARALLIDQHEVGAIQRSACAMPLDVATHLEVEGAVIQIYPSAVIHTPYGDTTFDLPGPYCIFDHERLCRLLFEQAGCDVLQARITGVDGDVVRTSSGDVAGDVLIDASGWSGALVTSLVPESEQPSYLSVGIEADVPGQWDDLHFYHDARYAPGGYAWVFPAGDELRVGVLSYRPGASLKSALSRFLHALGYEGKPVRGGRIPWFSRPSVVKNVMVAGDAAGHCMPITAEGIRFAFGFGGLAGRIARRIVDGDITREAGFRDYRQAARRHRRRIVWMRLLQRVVERSPALATHAWMRVLSARPLHDPFLRLYLQ